MAVGTSSTPAMNSLIVRPREILAMGQGQYHEARGAEDE